MQLPLYVFPSVLAGSVIVALAIVALTYGRRDRLSISFAIFCASWAALAWITTAVQITGNPMLARWSPAAVWTTNVSLAGYVLVLGGYDEALDTPVRGIRPRRWFIALAAWGVVAALCSGTTDLVVEGLQFSSLTGYSLDFATSAPFIQLPMGIMMLFVFVLIHEARRRAVTPSRQAFLRYNFYAIIALISGGALFAVFLPLLGLSTTALSFDGFSVIAFFFFGIIANYQFRQFEELNEELEAKVYARTEALRSAQTRLVQAEKMVALGSLVAGVAHEINTPLGAVRSVQDTHRRAAHALLDRARTANPDDRKIPRLARALEDAESVVDDGLGRIDEIVKRLRSFAKLDEAELQTVDPNLGLEEALSLLGPELDTIEVQRDLAAKEPITCLSRQMNQVFLNLLTNAVQAMPEGGRLGVHTEDTDQGLLVRISDDGHGIPVEHQARIFDPGFTTKGVGVGTGMGLAIAYRVVADQGGTLRVDSEPNAGTKVTVTLPRRPPPPDDSQG